jgi:TetR/AcrR family transcriptional regulator
MGIAERREREKEQRRNDIIDAAEKVFFSKGLEDASMDEVAESAELSKGTLYLYFKSKEELYLAIHLRGNRILRDMFAKAVNTPQNGLEKTRAVGWSYFEYYQNYPNYFNAMIYYESREIDFADSSPVAQQCLLLGKETLDILAGAIVEGIEDGSIRSSVDPVKTAISLWGQTTGIIQIIALKADIIKHNYQLNAEEIVDYTFDLIYHSLKSE